MSEIVVSHTHQHGDFKMRYGHPLPFGVSMVKDGINFSIYSTSATQCILVLYDNAEEAPFAEIPFPPEFRIGDVFAMTVLGLDPEGLEYAYRFNGPSDPRNGHRFDIRRALLDPYARQVVGLERWMERRETGRDLTCLGHVTPAEFDWEHDRPLQNPESDLIIYELHVRGFTRHETSGVPHPGTYLGLQEKMAYLLELGVTCVELMPVFEFDECENPRTNPQTGERLCNYWGYSTIGFFSPKTSYAAKRGNGGPAEELKSVVKALHAAGIEVILDVVYNHTAEAGEDGPTISFRGIDNATYYLLDENGEYANFTGCGNTVNCNHPVVRSFVRDSLRYWAAEYHIDGFRFDLASVLGRSPSGAPMPNPPLLEELAYDPVLAHCDLIAEAWDAGGLYQVGNFPAYGRWMEWNGKFRDAARRFLKGDTGVTPEMVQRIMGSPDLYAAAGRKPTASVNFITCHDGFTLRDLFSYNEKHNFENGESNADGANDNNSWNCGVEGESADPAINTLRLRMQKNALALLLLSQGVPMLSMGDEVGRSQRGNNNAYCHDEPWNWLDWSLHDTHADLFRFTKNLIAFRKANPMLRRSEFFTGKDTVGSGYPDISWHGVQPWQPDWSPPSRSVAFMLCGRHGKALGGPAHFIYCVFNMYYEPLDFTLPTLPNGAGWFRFLNTALPSPEDIGQPEGENLPAFSDATLRVPDRSCVVLLGK